ncbi:MAG: AraC family transcriptional regulator [Bacilli bacterium]
MGKQLLVLNDDSLEKVQYTTENYQLYVRKGNLSLFNFRAPAHWHMDIEIVIILSGEMDYYIEGTVVHLTKGEGIFINPKKIHYGYSEDHKECYYICLLFNPLVLSINGAFNDKYIYPFFEGNGVSYIHLKPEISWNNQICELVQKIYDLPNNLAYPVYALGNIFQIVGLYFENISSNQKKSSDQNIDILKKMVGFIQDHFKEKITLDDIAREGNVCKSQCCKVFNKELHRSPIGYLNDFRLDKSIYFLLNTDKSIVSICYEVGFDNPSYFSETFKKNYGSTPSQFKTNTIAGINKAKKIISEHENDPR